MGNDEQIVMAVKNDALFSADSYFNGLYAEDKVNFEQRILESFGWMRRGDAEKNYDYKQPIGYCFIVNPQLKKIFAYKRASKEGAYHEKRLYGKWSLGIGGHIEKDDISINPIKEGMKREIAEEVTMNGKIDEIIPVGYINDDNDDVGRVHFAVLYVALTDSSEVKPTSGHENEIGELMTLSELNEITSSIDCTLENWSKLALPILERFLK